MFYFYCPNCDREDRAFKLPKGTVGNCRDGWGLPIHHYECPTCHNLDAGYMMIRLDDYAERKYYRGVIRHYQGIRGIKQNEESEDEEAQ